MKKKLSRLFDDVVFLQLYFICEMDPSLLVFFFSKFDLFNLYKPNLNRINPNLTRI